MEDDVLGTLHVKSEPSEDPLSYNGAQEAGVESTTANETAPSQNQEEQRMEAEVIGTLHVKSEPISEDTPSADVAQEARVESTAEKETEPSQNREEQIMEAEVIGTLHVKSEPISEDRPSSDATQEAGVKSTADKEAEPSDGLSTANKEADGIHNQEEPTLEAEVIGTIHIKSEPIFDAAKSNSAKEKSDTLVDIGTLYVKSEPISEETSRTNGRASEVVPVSADESSVAQDAVPQAQNVNDISSPVGDNLLAAAEHSNSTRINPELQFEEMDEEPPDSFFADLLESAENIRTVALTPPPTANATDTTSVRVKNEVDDLPANFFDELLVDRIAERVQEAVFAGGNDELETKYSLKLKELQKLQDNEASRSKAKSAHKKHKKTKKKSRKRSRGRSKERSRSRSSENGRKRSRHSQSPSHKRRRRSRTPSRHTNQSLPAIFLKSEMDLVASSNHGSLPRANMANTSQRPTSSIYQELDPLPVRNPTATDGDDDAASSSFGGFKRIKLEKVSKDVAPPIANDEPEIVITPKMKRQKSMQRTIATIEAFRNAQKKPATHLSTFVYTATVRKLPASSSYVTQQIYENRSPLHTVNNVSYKFNSSATRFNFQELGLEALSSTVSRVAKIVGCDAHMVSAKLKSAKVPMKMQRIKSELNEHGEVVEETRSSFFTNAMTQTDDVTIIAERRSNTASMGVQARPTCGSIGTQTSSTMSSSSNDDLPLMKLMDELNENQLLALSDFAELLREPASNAMDMYRLRQRMLDIYKCSRLPSAMAAMPNAPSMYEVQSPPPPVMHSRSTNNASGDPRTRTHINDPRQRYTTAPHQPQRAHHFAAAPLPQQHAVPLTIPYPHQNPAPSTYQRSSQVPSLPPAPGEMNKKYFGRGGMRR